MKKLILTVMALGLVLSGANAYAITIDGSLADWDPAYVVNGDGFTWPGVGGQEFDVEKTGLYASGSSLFFGLQTGFHLVRPSQPQYNSWAGDIFFDFGSGDWDYAMRWSVNAMDFSQGVGNSDVTLSLYEVNSYVGAPHTNTWVTPYRMTSGTLKATISGSNSHFGWFYDDPLNPDYYEFHNTLEGIIDLNLFNLSAESFNGDNMARIFWTMDCGNDIGYNTYPVPEPMSMALLGMGVLGLVVRRKK